MSFREVPLNRLSPFRPGASNNEKWYVVAMLSWVALTALGAIYFYLQGIHFGPDRDILPVVLFLSALCGFMAWLPVVKDRSTRIRLAAYPVLARISVYATLLFVFGMLTFASFHWAAAPFLTTSFGAPESGVYVVTAKSSGRARRRKCDFSVWLQHRESTWRTKACLRKEVWDSVRVGDDLRIAGHRGFLGRTLSLEQLPGR